MIRFQPPNPRPIQVAVTHIYGYTPPFAKYFNPFVVRALLSYKQLEDGLVARFLPWHSRLLARRG